MKTCDVENVFIVFSTVLFYGRQDETTQHSAKRQFSGHRGSDSSTGWKFFQPTFRQTSTGWKFFQPPEGLE
jgi:hypothetical protein